MFRTTGPHGNVLDYDDRVWDKNSAGAYMTLVANRGNRENLLSTTDQILSLVHDVTPMQRAFLDVLLLPMVQAWQGSDLNCEAILYVTNAIQVLWEHLELEDKMNVSLALVRVSKLDDEFASNLLGILVVETAHEIPDYLPQQGYGRRYAKLLVSLPRDDIQLLRCNSLKFLIEMVDDISKSGLLISLFFDAFLMWEGDDEELEQFADALDNNPDLPEAINPFESPQHRALTKEKIFGASSINEGVSVRGGKLNPAERGAIGTADFSGRCVGSVDGRRVVAFFQDGSGKLVVQFKNARNYLLNVLHFARPSQFLSTELREEIIDRDKLVGLPALHVLLRGRTSLRLARFIVGAFTFQSMSMKRQEGGGIRAVLGLEQGEVEFKGHVSPSILAAFPVLFDHEERLYIFHQDETYRLKFHRMTWRVSKEEMTDAPVGFGSLSTGFPLR